MGLAVIQTPLKDNQLTMMWKTIYDNNIAANEKSLQQKVFIATAVEQE